MTTAQTVTHQSPPSNDAPLLVVDNLVTHFSTPRGVLEAVNGISFTLNSGDSLGIVGESGSGKTVLSRSLIGLVPRSTMIQSGSVQFDGIEVVGSKDRDLRQIWGKRAAMIFQDPMTALNPVMRVGVQIEETLKINLRLTRRQARQRSIELLGQVGIPSPEERHKSYPIQLSGGMRQRVMIAIAIANGPELLLADEPTTGLDVTVQAQILDLIGTLQATSNMALILVTHDLGVVATRTNNIMVMYAGQVVEKATTREIFKRVAMPYTEALLRSTPRISAPSHTRLESIEGRPPDLVNRQPGCAFAPRCPYADDVCRANEPPLVESAIEPGHYFACFKPLNGHRPAVELTAPSMGA